MSFIGKRFGVQGSLTRRLVSGASWSLTSSVVAKGIALFGTIFLARLLGPEKYGQYGVVQLTIGAMVVFSGFGLGQTITKYVSEFRHSFPSRISAAIGSTITLSIIAACAGAGLLFFSSEFLAKSVLVSENLDFVLKIAAAILFCYALLSTLNGVLAGFESFSDIAKLSVISSLINFTLLLAGAYLGSLQGAIIGLAIGGVMSVGLAMRYVSKMRVDGSKIAYRGFSDWRLLLNDAVPTVLSGALVLPVTWMCSAILVNQPNGYVEMAALTAAQQWYFAILFVPSAVSTVILPILSGLEASGRHASYIKVILYNLALNFFVTLSLALLAAYFASEIIGVYKLDQKKYSIILVWLAAAAVLNASSGVLGKVLVSKGLIWQGFTINAIWAIVMLAYSWKNRASGAEGIAIATFTAYAVLTVLSVIYTYHLVRKERHRDISL